MAEAFVSGNGVQYGAIATHGYRYEARPERWNVAFFPAYPMLGRWLSWATGISNKWSLLAIAHASLLGAMILFHRYVQDRGEGSESSWGEWSLAAFGLWPTTVFFRMAYTESLFVLIAIAAMFLMQRRAHPLWVALVIGLGTATRPVGVCLLAPLAMYLWERAGESNAALDTANGKSPPTRFRLSLRWNSGRLSSFAIWLPLACWGIGGFVLFQYIAFGEPLAFCQAQQYWGERPPVPYFEQWGRALIAEPIWSVYDPASIAHWARAGDVTNPLFSLPFANPAYWVVSCMLVVIGWRKRWLNGKEIVLALLLIGVPYFTHSYRHLMLSHGRFSALAFPTYMVMGHLMARMPRALVAALCALAGILLAVYAAEFAAGYRVT